MIKVKVAGEERIVKKPQEYAELMRALHWIGSTVLACAIVVKTWGRRRNGPIWRRMKIELTGKQRRTEGKDKGAMMMAAENLKGGK
jgi:hypothetical protein